MASFGPTVEYALKNVIRGERTAIGKREAVGRSRSVADIEDRLFLFSLGVVDDNMK